MIRPAERRALIAGISKAEHNRITKMNGNE